MYKLHEEHCSNPKTSCKRNDVIRGEVTDFAFKCYNDPIGLRGTLAACGPTAKWFEEKEKPIPICKDCRYSDAVEFVCFKRTHNYLTGFDKLGWTCEEARNSEDWCGKYGKWWEKKEEPLPGMIKWVSKDELEKLYPKKQSWLCRLICGRKQ
jgi:hypothetical protein